MTHITTNVDEAPVKRWIFTLDTGVEPIRNFSGAEMHREGSYIIHVNGTPFALTRYPKRFAARVPYHAPTRLDIAFCQH